MKIQFLHQRGDDPGFGDVRKTDERGVEFLDHTGMVSGLTGKLLFQWRPIYEAPMHIKVRAKEVAQAQEFARLPRQTARGAQ